MDLDEVLIDDDILDEENATRDIRDYSALEKSNKTVSALNHCNYFLKGYCAKEKLRYVKLEDIPYCGIDKKGNLFWDRMIASFLNYLGASAKCNFDSANDGLSYQTATQYASQVKQYLINKFRLKDRISVFREEQWKVLRKQLLSMYKENCKKAGKKLVNGHEGSSDDDRVAIGTACLWLGDTRSAHFFALENAKYYAAGRCREISLLEVKDVTLKHVNEDGRSFRVLAVKVERDKQGGSQNLPLYPHRDHMQQDIYFAIAYSVLVTGHVETYLFKEFAERAKRHLQGVSKSSVSQLWNTAFKALFKQFGEIADQVNLNLKSHHGKSGSNQKLAENPLTAGLPQVLHTGWDVRSVHTIFEYVVGSESMSRQTGKVLSNWSSSVEMGIIGGEPPSIKDIRGEDNLRKARAVCSWLFKDDYDSRWSPAIREVLFASILRFFPDLKELLEQHPKSAYKNLKSHAFVRMVYEAFETIDVGITVFEGWCGDVRKGFLQRNAVALPINVLTDNGYDGLNEIQVDARSFLTQMNTMTRAYLAMTKQQALIGEDLRRVLDKLDEIIARQDKLEGMVVKLARDRNEEKEGDRLVYSEVVSTYQPKTPARLFVRFFKDSLHVLYYEQLKSVKWKTLSQKEKARAKSSFRRQKRCVRYMLCFMASFPPKPAKISKAYSDWLKMMTTRSEAAEKKLLDYWKTKTGENCSKLTFAMLEGDVFEELDARFADNPPDGMSLEDMEIFRSK